MHAIAMTYDNSPVVRSVVGVGERVVYLALDHAELAPGVAPRSIGFPKEFVFEHDSELFHALVDAHRINDLNSLVSLWQAARPLAIDG